MRLLLYSRSTRSATPGGMEQIFSQLAAGMTARGYTVLRAYSGASFAPVPADENAFDVKLISLKKWRQFPRSSLLLAPSSTVGLYRFLRAARPDVVNCHLPDSRSLYFSLLKPLFNYRLVVSLHGSDVFDADDFEQWVLAVLLKKADHVVAVSDSLADAANRIAPIRRKTTVIPNGIDLAYWRNEARYGDVAAQASPLLVSVGALRRVKGHDVLIRAMPTILQRVPNARLAIVGDGPERASLEALVSELGVQQVVEILGQYDREGIRELFGKASVFVFPSRSEGMGIALVEAMAAGVPVIASDVGGIPGFVQDGRTGLLVPPDDPDALATAICELLVNRQKCVSLVQAAAQSVEQFGVERMLNRYEQVFQR